MEHVSEIIPGVLDKIRDQSGRRMVIEFSGHIRASEFALLLGELPQDSFIMGCDREIMNGTNVVCVWAPTFDEVPLGHRLPRLIGHIQKPENKVWFTTEDGREVDFRRDQ